ncbi:MAG: hypothetical protein HRT71_20855 [Flavobacteriales bacterium]|nr:hypothetical protein [Flavobacteriales bacterium]
MEVLNKFIRFVTNHWLAFVFACVISFIFSCATLFNNARSESDPNFHYQAIKYGAGAASDDYHYYAHIKKIVEGDIPFTESDVIEKDGNITHISVTLFVSYLLASVGGLFTSDINEVYAINFIIWPAVNFLLIYLILMQFLKRNLIAIFLALFSILFYGFSSTWVFPQVLQGIYWSMAHIGTGWKIPLSLNPIAGNEFFRTPNILTTNVILMLFTLSYYFFISNINKAKRISLGIFFTASLTALAYTYPILIYVGYSIVLAGFFFSWKKSKEIIPFVAVAVVLSSYSFWQLLQPYLNPNEYYQDLFNMISTMPYNTRLRIISTLTSFTFIIALLYGSSPFKKKSVATNFHFTILCGVALAYLLSNLINGGFFSDRVFYRGGAIPYFLSASLLVFAYFREAHYRKSFAIGFSHTTYRPIKIKDNFFTNLVSIAFQNNLFWFTAIIIITFASATNQINYAAKKSNYYHDKNGVLKLSEWLNENTNKNEVFLTLDPELILHLPVYTHLKTFNPVRGRSQVGIRERTDRLFESLKYFKVPPKAFESSLKKMVSHRFLGSEPDYGKTQLSLFELSFFYTINKKLPLNTVDTLSNNYELAEKTIDLTRINNSVDYVITSQYNSVVDSLYCEKCIVRKLEKVYEFDNSFSVYKTKQPK